LRTNSAVQKYLLNHDPIHHEGTLIAAKRFSKIPMDDTTDVSVVLDAALGGGGKVDEGRLTSTTAERDDKDNSRRISP